MNRTIYSLPHRSSAIEPLSLPVSQRGVSLVIVLLFLVAITGITIWAARQSMLGEGAARNQLDREVAYQAAQAALRDAERDLNGITTALLPNASCPRMRAEGSLSAFFSADCSGGLCGSVDEQIYATSNWQAASAGNPSVAEPWWPTGRGGKWNNDFSSKPGRSPVTTTNCSFTGGVPLGTYTGAAAIRGVAVQPEYLVEQFLRYAPFKQTMVYRITARGFGYQQRTQVVLQADFIPTASIK